MLNMKDIMETVQMIEEEHLDIRTITMGISLLSCCDPDIDRSCQKVYDKITAYAKDLVQVGEQIEAEYGIPIINKRISVTPIAMLAAASGGDRRISLCRELTKLHEEVLRLTLDGAVAYYETQPPRGEYVLIVEGAPKQQESGPVSEEEALMRVQALLAEGLSRKDAVRQVAAETGLAKNQLYDAALRAQHTETE